MQSCTNSSTDSIEIREKLDNYWKNSYPYFESFINLPSLSPAFNKTEDDHRLLEESLHIVINYINSLGLNGVNIELSKCSFDENLSPFLLVTIDPTRESYKTIGFYAHADKQPPFTDKWDDGLHPYKLVKRDNKLYGRGTVDDGYALFSIFNLIKVIQEHNTEHDKYIVMIETSEESGSCHLSHYLEKYSDLLKDMSHLICMDSGGPTGDRLWFTSSLRGCFMGELTVSIGNTEIHSGDGGGVVPSPYRILNSVLARIENPENGKMKCLHTNIPESHLLDMVKASSILSYNEMFAFPVNNEIDMFPNASNKQLRLYIRNSWKPSLTVIGFDGLPTVAEGGNAINPTVSAKLSIRLPPNMKASDAKLIVKNILEKNPPHNAKVLFEPSLSCDGWVSKDLDNNMISTLNNASNTFYHNPVGFISSGGSIPIMGLLQEKLSQCVIVATGILTSESNAHGPNEFLCTNALSAFNISMYNMLIGLSHS